MYGSKTGMSSHLLYCNSIHYIMVQVASHFVLQSIFIVVCGAILCRSFLMLKIVGDCYDIFNIENGAVLEIA